MKRKKSIFKYVAAALALVVFAAAAIAFFGDKGDQVPVIMSSVPVSRGTVITGDNFDSLFEIKNVSADMVKEDAISDKDVILGKTLSFDMAENEILCGEKISDMENNMAVMANPVVAGIRAADISQFSGGIIRAGDHIDISVVDSNTGKCSNVISNVYVTEAFNSDGTAIEGEGCAMILNVLIEKEAEQYLNEMLAVGTVRVCRLERSTDE